MRPEGCRVGSSSGLYWTKRNLGERTRCTAVSQCRWQQVHFALQLATVRAALCREAFTLPAFSMGTPGQGKEVSVYSKSPDLPWGQPGLYFSWQLLLFLRLKRSGPEVTCWIRVHLHVAHTGTAYSTPRDTSTNICVFVTSTEPLIAACWRLMVTQTLWRL